MEQCEIGQNLFDEKFVKDRIQSGEINLWSTMKKRKLQPWKTMGKKKMMVICKSRPEIDIQEAVGTYEFTVVPRSMFATDGEMLHRPAKSVLMSILEKLPAKTDDCRALSQDATSQGERNYLCKFVSWMQWLKCNP